MTVIEQTAQTYGVRGIELVTLDKDAEIELLLQHNGKLAAALEDTLLLLGNRLQRIDDLEKAGWDVLPTLELYWKGERPIPEWHATGTLRRVLEEGQE